MNYCKTVGEFDMDLLSTIEDFKLIKDLNPETLVTLIRNNRFYSETGGCYESLSEWLFNSIIRIVKPGLRLGWRQREDFKNVYSFKVDKIKDEVTKILLKSGFIRKTSGPNIAIMRFLIMKTKSWFCDNKLDSEAIRSKAKRLSVYRPEIIYSESCYFEWRRQCCEGLFNFYSDHFFEPKPEVYETFDYDAFELDMKTVLEGILSPEQRKFIEWYCLSRWPFAVVAAQDLMYIDAAVFSVFLTINDINKALHVE